MVTEDFLRGCLGLIVIISAVGLGHAIRYLFITRKDKLEEH